MPSGYPDYGYITKIPFYVSNNPFYETTGFKEILLIPVPENEMYEVVYFSFYYAIGNVTEMVELAIYDTVTGRVYAIEIIPSLPGYTTFYIANSFFLKHGYGLVCKFYVQDQPFQGYIYVIYNKHFIT